MDRVARWRTLLIAAVATSLAAGLFAIPGDPSAKVGGPKGWFWFTMPSTALCVVLSIIVFAAGRRRGLAELAILGASLVGLSTLSWSASLLTPGYLVDATDAAAGIAAVLALPIAIVVAAPVLVANTAFGRRAARRWRWWSAGGLGLAGASVAVLILGSANLQPIDRFLGWLLLAAASVAVLIVASRQLRLYAIGRRVGSFAAAIAFVAISADAAVVYSAALGSPRWWVGQAIDGLSVLLAGAGMLRAYRRDRDVAEILRPVTAREPLAALELGLTPEIHAFIAALDRKDPITRDHVVRVATLAMRVGERAGLSPRRLRSLGLGALLHDVGKLLVPSDIINKPNALTDAEYARMKSHAEQGAALLADSLALSPVAPLVRSHHERPDGRGYPDRLTGTDIALEVEIISACDAWDAMTNTRQYRVGMDRSRAVAVLRDGMGTQWTAQSVELLLATVADEWSDGTGLESAGRHARADEVEAIWQSLPESSLDACLPERLVEGVRD